MNTAKKKHKKSVHVIKNENLTQMSTKTMDFIQKICYKQTASVDMTKYGFISDSKLQPINLLIKPLRAQLDKIIGDKVHPLPILKQPSNSSQKKVNDKRAVKFNIKGNQSSTHSTVSKQESKKQVSVKTKNK